MYYVQENASSSKILWWWKQCSQTLTKIYLISVTANRWLEKEKTKKVSGFGSARIFTLFPRLLATIVPEGNLCEVPIVPTCRLFSFLSRGEVIKTLAIFLAGCGVILTKKKNKRKRSVRRCVYCVSNKGKSRVFQAGVRRDGGVQELLANHAHVSV